MLMKIISLTRFRCSTRRLAIFAGQGTQQMNMLQSLLNIPAAKSEIEEHSHQLGIDFIGITQNEANKHMLNQTQITQPLIVMSQCLHAKFRLPKTSKIHNQYGIQHTDTLIGHSIGQYSALVAAGSISLSECLSLVKKRGQLMVSYTSQPSGMLFIRFNESKRQILDQILNQQEAQIAGYNTKHNIIVGGNLQKLTLIRDQLKIKKITSIFLPVSTAFHCKMLTEMKIPYREELQKLQLKPPICTILRNYDTDIYSEKQTIVDGLVEHLTNPVLFFQSVARELKKNLGMETIEIGHKQSLMKFVQEIKKSLSP